MCRSPRPRFGKRVFVEDDGTVTSVANEGSVSAGVVDELGADGLVYVYFG